MLALVAQLLAISGAVGVSVAYIHRSLWSNADALLQSRMVKLLALVGEDDDNPRILEFDAEQANVPTGDLFYIADDQGHRIAGNFAWVGPILDHLRTAGETWTFKRDGRAFRAAAMWNAAILDQEDNHIPQLHVNLFYAMPVEGTETQIERASRVAVLAGLLSVLFSALLTWLAVGRGMQPLTDFARYADQIEVDGTDFSGPGDVGGNTELVPLARALAALEDRVRQAFQRERRFLSDAAHELKTAVAIEKSTLQLLEQERPSKDAYRRGVSQALEDTNRIERLVQDMLLLSSLEHPRQAAPATSSLLSVGDSIVGAIEQLTPIAQIRSVSCVFDDTCNARIRGSESDLTLLWTNLLENAVQHSEPGTEVQINVEDVESGCRVRVIDKGSGISCVDLPHVFERFYRSDTSRSRLTGGFGLGLSIAKAIVENLNGTIYLSSVPGEGTTVEVTLPAQQTAHAEISSLRKLNSQVSEQSPKPS
ncbi:sensor histidine kinase [Acidipila rosea]|uniref:histidine kinase n=1 Tax=Acidipila rosea TaxID=768535 RepID=A0A4R1LEB6_9BACT|nr:HAMP domain-containing sensor histidine kinase [Acidipila rosea]TCK75910.1 signal transduction histidine kinase [Acidipila rosea]